MSLAGVLNPPTSNSAASAAVVVMLTASAAANAAMVTAASLAYGAIFLAGVGTYEFSDTIVLSSNTYVTQDPRITLKVADGTNKELFRNYGSTGTWASAVGSDGLFSNENITLDGLNIDLNYANNNTIGSRNSGAGGTLGTWCGFGMEFVRCLNARVLRCRIVGRPYDAATRLGKYLISFTACTNPEASYNYFNNTSDGVHFSGKCVNPIAIGNFGTTNDDFVALTPTNGAGYSAYTIAGTEGMAINPQFHNNRNEGNGGAVLIHGLVYSGANYLVVGGAANGNYSKPVAVPSSTVPNSVPTSATVSHGGWVGGEVNDTFGWLPRTCPLINGKCDNPSGETSYPSSVVFRNSTRRDQETAAPAGGDSTGRIFNCEVDYKASKLVFDGFASQLADGTDAWVSNNGSAAFNFAAQTASGGYITEVIIRNGRLRAADYLGAAATNGKLCYTDTGLGYNGTAYVGGISLEDNTLSGFQYLSLVPSFNTAVTHRWIVDNNRFTDVSRGIKMMGAGSVAFSRNIYGGTTERLIELFDGTGAATTQVVDLKVDGTNHFNASDMKLCWSSSTSYTLKSCRNGSSGVERYSAAATVYVTPTGANTIVATNSSGVLDIRLRDSGTNGTPVTIINKTTGTGTVTVKSATASTNNIVGVTTYSVALNAEVTLMPDGIDQTWSLIRSAVIT